jgi:hypothetical protein
MKASPMESLPSIAIFNRGPEDLKQAVKDLKEGYQKESKWIDLLKMLQGLAKRRETDDTEKQELIFNSKTA